MINSSLLEQTQPTRMVSATLPQRVSQLFESHLDGLYAYTASLVRNADDTRDVMQNLFVRMLRNPDAFLNAKSVKPYLFSAVRNEALRFLAKAGVSLRHEQIPNNDFTLLQLPAKHTGDGALEETREKLNRSLNSLPQEQREIIQLKFYEDLTFEETAAILGIPAATAQSRYRLALQKLKEKFRHANV